MKYETWIRLSEVKQEEYRYKFGEPNKPYDFSFSCLDFLNSYFKFLIGLFAALLSFIALSKFELVSKDLVSSLFLALFKIMGLIPSVMIIILITMITERIIFMIKYIMWLKVNKIGKKRRNNNL